MPIRTPTPPPNRLEIFTLGHLGLFLAGATWMLGGSPPWAKQLLSIWGSLGLGLMAAALLRRPESGRSRWRLLVWLWPFLLFNGLVLLSCRTPSYREIHIGTRTVLVPLTNLKTWPPNAALPDLSLRGLWLFDAIYLSCFNLLLIIRRRRTLRALLLFAAANAFVLAVFGTLQHFSDAKGPFFNMAPTQQSFFFSSFIYHNHWGAFAVLMTALCLGLTWHYVQRRGTANFFHTPAFAGLVATLFLAVTEPLSESRSCMGLIAPLLLASFGQWLLRLIRQRRQLHESVALPIVGTGVGAAVVIAGAWYVAAADISARLGETRKQLIASDAPDGVSLHALWLFLQSRFTLYGDTWRMARDKLWFGWGMNSYAHVFQQYNSQQISKVDGLPTYYFDAHNDWLQSAAEHGLVGTGLLGLCALVPLLHGARRHELAKALPLYLMAGCALILIYAWFEFPFGNTGVVVTWWLLFFAALQYSRLRSSAASASSGSSHRGSH